jgi:hypothetical protein
MYEFVKRDNEEIIIISDDSVLMVNNAEKSISSILTNQRLLLFDIPSKSNNYQEVLKVSRGVNYIKQKELILSIELNDIVDIVGEKYYDKYILNNTNFFYLRDLEIKNKIKEIK